MKISKVRTEGEKITAQIQWGDGSITTENFRGENSFSRFLEKYTTEIITPVLQRELDPNQQ